MRIGACAAVSAATLSVAGSLSFAQAPGLTPSTGHLPLHHAVPPPPELFPSPMPSLPPPSRNAPFEPTIGFAIGTAGFTAVVDADGTINFGEDHAGFWIGADPVVGLAALLQFDGSDEAMRAARYDPYLPQKLRIMDATREDRWEMRRAHDVVVMQRALDDLPRYLDAVWTSPAWSAATRRELLFALWDEAAEDGNELLRTGGAEARRIIEAFVAYRLPPGSRHAFRVEELARLNRGRQSRQSFAPYRSSIATAASAAAAPAPLSRELVAALRAL